MKDMECSQFEIGEVVRVAAKPENVVQILERCEQTCPGGTQVFYDCRLYSKNAGMHKDYWRFLAIELERIPETEPLSAMQVLEASKQRAIDTQEFDLAAEIRALIDKFSQTSD